ncbi:hypothetical protein KCU99_g33, partial [Aureobasidium melanogenum]
MLGVGWHVKKKMGQLLREPRALIDEQYKPWECLQGSHVGSRNTRRRSRRRLSLSIRLVLSSVVALLFCLSLVLRRHASPSPLV